MAERAEKTPFKHSQRLMCWAKLSKKAIWKLACAKKLRSRPVTANKVKKKGGILCFYPSIFPPKLFDSRPKKMIPYLIFPYFHQTRQKNRKRKPNIVSNQTNMISKKFLIK